jgi:nucleotide-binding universal stress UspA family protein
MRYKTILVHLQLGYPHDALLQLAGRLAARHGAALTGVAVSQPMQALVGDGCVEPVLISDDLAREMALCERSFYAALGDRPSGLQWLSNSDCASLSGFVADAARAADLILTDAPPAVFFDAQRQVNMGDVLMRAGRPLLLTPPTARPLLFQHALLAWDDGRQCRRAATDALSLLQDCARVSVAQLTPRDGEAATTLQLNDVVAWLATHGIDATPLALRGSGDPHQIAAIANDHACDLVVAGAYGHSRVREWALGGVTRALLAQQHVSVLLAH